MVVVNLAPITLRFDPAARWTLPVDPSLQRPINASCFPHLGTVTDFTFTIYRALHAATRYLHVDGREAPTEDDLTRFRLSTLLDLDNSLDFDPANGHIEPRSKGRLFSGEYRKTPAERLAYGLALVFLRRSWRDLRLSDVRMIADTDDDARPDFALPVPGPNGERLALEVRARGYRSSLTPKEIAQLDAKKRAGFDAILAVYFHYGEAMGKRSHTTGRKARTRLFIADPSGERNIPDEDNLLMALRRYKDIVHQLRLRIYENRLDEAIARLQSQESLPEAMPGVFPESASLHHPQRRWYGGQRYIGRVFSSLLSEMPPSHEVLDRLRRGDLGLYSFAGVNESILRAIHEARWNMLVDFVHRVDDDELPGNVTLSPEGYVIESAVVLPGSEQAAEVIASLNRER